MCWECQIPRFWCFANNIISQALSSVFDVEMWVACRRCPTSQVKPFNGDDEMKRVLLSSAGALAMITAGFGASHAVIEEITVTAQKREQSASDVPISMTALSGDLLTDLNATDFDDMLDFVPGAFFASRGVPGENSFVLRGMGVTANGTAANVAIYIDEMPVTSAKRIPEIRTFDVDRVEVLRGPQGTLYGEGAMGGALKVINKKPELSGFDAALSITGENTDDGGFGFSTNFMLNLPIAEDKAGLRIVGFHQDLDGFIDDVSTGEENHNGHQISGGRAIGKFNLSDNADLVVTYYHEEQSIDGFGDHDPSGLGDLLTDNIGVDEYRDNKFTAWTAVLNWDLGFGTLTSATSDYKYEASGRSYTGFNSAFDNDHSAFVQEVRLTSNPGSGPDTLDWLVGAFYKTLESGENFPDFFFGTRTDIDQLAAFFDVTVRASDELAFSFGGRYAKEEAHGEFIGVRTEDTDDSSFTPRLVATFTPSDESLFYASASSGFRASGVSVFAASLTPPLDADATFEHDSVWNYELGGKFSNSDRSFMANVAVYYSDWEDIQVVLDPPGPGFKIINGEGATVYGIEGDATWSPVDIEGLSVSIAGSYVDATFDAADPSGLLGYAKGDRIADVPEWTASAILGYERPVSSGLTAFGQLEFSARSDYIHVTRSVIPSSNQTNLRFGLESERGWEAVLWVENVTNDLNTQALDNDISFFPIPQKPRTVGVTFRTDFGDLFGG